MAHRRPIDSGTVGICALTIDRKRNRFTWSEPVPEDGRSEQ
jgi:hypothetical protein